MQDRYRVERELGEGGAATVYLARDLRHDRPVAPDRQVAERADEVLSQGPNIAADSRAAMNLIVGRAFERLGDTRRALQAATRAGPGEILFSMRTPAMLDQARLNVAAGDTALAITIYRAHLLNRRAAEPKRKKADEPIQRKLDELLRLRR